jgi:hypothetical protein
VKLSTSPYARFWIIAMPPSKHSVDEAHYPMHFHAASTRRQCIAEFMRHEKKLWNPDRPEATRTWRGWYRHGYRCVRVRAVPA